MLSVLKYSGGTICKRRNDISAPREVEFGSYDILEIKV
jgi:hypothetical protein